MIFKDVEGLHYVSQRNCLVLLPFVWHAWVADDEVLFRRRIGVCMMLEAHGQSLAVMCSVCHSDFYIDV